MLAGFPHKRADIFSERFDTAFLKDIDGTNADNAVDFRESGYSAVIIKIIRAVDKESSLPLFYGKTAFYAPHLLAERILKDISVLAFDSDLPIFDQKM